MEHKVTVTKLIVRSCYIECLGCENCFDGRQVSIEHTAFACSAVGAQTTLLHFWYYAAGNFNKWMAFWMNSSSFLMKLRLCISNIA